MLNSLSARIKLVNCQKADFSKAAQKGIEEFIEFASYYDAQPNSNFYHYGESAAEYYTSILRARLNMKFNGAKPGPKLEDHIQLKQNNETIKRTLQFLNRGIDLIYNNLFAEACEHFRDSDEAKILKTGVEKRILTFKNSEEVNWFELDTYKRFVMQDIAQEARYDGYINVPLPIIPANAYKLSRTNTAVKEGLDYLFKETALLHLEEWLHHLQHLHVSDKEIPSIDKSTVLMPESGDSEEDIARIFIALNLKPSAEFFDRHPHSRKHLISAT